MTLMARAVQVSALATLLALAFTRPADAASLDSARAMERAGDYRGALQAYKQWLASDDAYGAEKRYVKIKLPVLEEAQKLGASPDLEVFLDALSARANQNVPAALAQLEQLQRDFPDSRLQDDSRYLIGYIQMMDQFDFAAASESMQRLQSEFPDSRYFDTALYSQAIAEEQLGNTDYAAALFGKLRDRHTAMSIETFDLFLPRNTLGSRYWFDRSDERLQIIEHARLHAAKLIHRATIQHAEYDWRLIIAAADRHHTVLVKPSALMQNAEIKGPGGSALQDAGIETLEGIVDGETNSWVRLTLQGKSISGVISIHGQRVPLIAAATAGTLSDYNTLLRSDIDGNDPTQTDDAPSAPPAANPIDSYLRSLRQNDTDYVERVGVTHVARLGVVIDSQYNDYHGGNGFQHALSILNTTDGIFRDELGIALHIETVIVITDRNNDDMNIGRVRMVDMMRNFRDYRNTNPVMTNSDIGLATLFSGNQRSDEPLGLAWIGTACRTDGYDVSVVTPFSQPELLSAHEIAHTMGANHDVDSACGEARNLMSERLSGDISRTFSSCSKQEVSALLARTSCHSEAIDLAVDFGAITPSEVQLSLLNTDMVREVPAANLRIEMTDIAAATYPDNCSSTGSDSLLCQFGSIRSIDSEQITISLPDSVDTSASITAYAEPVGFSDVATGNNAKVADLYGGITSFVPQAEPVTPIIVADQSGGTPTTPSVIVGGGAGSLPPISMVILGLLGLSQLLANPRVH